MTHFPGNSNAIPLPPQSSRRLRYHAHKSNPYKSDSHHRCISFYFKMLRRCPDCSVCPISTTFPEFLAHFLAHNRGFAADFFSGFRSVHLRQNQGEATGQGEPTLLERVG
jgi:hypothetical protein